jgi:antitoxin Phd
VSVLNGYVAIYRRRYSRGAVKIAWFCGKGRENVRASCDSKELLTSHLTSQYDGLREARCLMSSWQVQDAKARFSEFLDATVKKGPQIVTRRGVETAVLVPIDEWRRLQQSARRDLKSLLLEPRVRFEEIVVERGNLKRRPPLDFK